MFRRNVVLAQSVISFINTLIIYVSKQRYAIVNEHYKNKH